MPEPEHHEIAGHEVVEVRTAEACGPYDRLVVRESKGRTIRMVLDREPADQGWTVTGIRPGSGGRPGELGSERYYIFNGVSERGSVGETHNIDMTPKRSRGARGDGVNFWITLLVPNPLARF